MGAGVNSCTFVGTVHKNDAEMQYTPKGTAKTTCMLKVNNAPFNGEKAGATYIPLVMWGKIAEEACTQLTAGALVAVTGRLSTYSYEKDGNKVWGWNINVNTYEVIGADGEPAEQREAESSSVPF